MKLTVLDHRTARDRERRIWRKVGEQWVQTLERLPDGLSSTPFLFEELQRELREERRREPAPPAPHALDGKVERIHEPKAREGVLEPVNERMRLKFEVAAAQREAILRQALVTERVARSHAA